MLGPRILWFRRDLRLADHPALVEAADAGGDAGVVGLFVIDPVLWGSGGVRTAYLADALRALDAALDGSLVVRTGRPADVVPAIARETGASGVHVSGDAAPYGRRRDAAVAAALDADGVGWHPSGTPYAVEPGTVLKGDGTPFRVFTPFYRAWVQQPVLPVHPVPRVRWRSVAGEPIPQVAIADGPTLPPAGEDASLERWHRFLADGCVERYAADRDRPDLDGTTALSHALRWGEVHPRTLLADLDGSTGAESLRRELAWREFYADVLHHTPASAWTDLRGDLGAMRFDTGREADARFAAWCAGRTGFPFVDAGMRQLLAEGWMHNRVRMVTASFLVKDLHLPWQRGARWFLDHLRDGDVASNQHGWQWTAGTGTDAAPYFRVFNPVTQGRRFDPDGDYVRRYVPELRGIDGADAHEPWLAPLLAPDYPERIVDHAAERDEALARYEAARAAAAAGDS